MKKPAFEAKSMVLALGAFGVFAVGALMTTVIPPLVDPSLHSTSAANPVHEYTDAEARGMQLYVREGCVYCHTQQIRDEVTLDGKRYGWRTIDAEVSEAWEYVNDRPHLLGTKRTGPDLARLGGKYSSEWHWAHFQNPRDMGEKFFSGGVNPRAASIMPTFKHFTEEEIKDLTAYLQTLGRNKNWRSELNDFED